MSQDKLILRRIEIATIVKVELSKAIREGKIELEKAGELSGEIANKLKASDSIEALNLEFAKLIKQTAIFAKLGIRLEELKKSDLDSEIAEMVKMLIEKGDYDKALSLGNQVISVYVRNPDINLDDFRLELLKKEHALTSKQSTKMHQTVEQRQQGSPPPTKKELDSHSGTVQAIKHHGPVEEGQILQEGEVFSEPGKEEFHDPAEDIKTPEIDMVKTVEKKEKFKENVKKLGSLLKDSTGEVTGETTGKLKDATFGLLAKAQEKFGKKE